VGRDFTTERPAQLGTGRRGRRGEALSSSSSFAPPQQFFFLRFFGRMLNHKNRRRGQRGLLIRRPRGQVGGTGGFRFAVWVFAHSGHLIYVLSLFRDHSVAFGSSRKYHHICRVIGGGYHSPASPSGFPQTTGISDFAVRVAAGQHPLPRKRGKNVHAVRRPGSVRNLAGALWELVGRARFQVSLDEPAAAGSSVYDSSGQDNDESLDGFRVPKRLVWDIINIGGVDQRADGR